VADKYKSPQILQGNPSIKDTKSLISWVNIPKITPKKAAITGTLECVKIPELELSYKTKMIKFKFYGRRKKKVR
jgi:hypothetical protein